MTGPDPTARGDRAGRAGARLRLARLAAGLSQEQLAARAGVSRQAVAGIEAGRFDPSLRVALDLSRSLDRSVEDLFGPPAVLPAQPATLVASPRPAGSAGGDGRAGGARVELARVGERAVAFSLFGDTAMRPGFLPALGRVAGPAEGGSAGGTPAGPGGEPVLVESGPSGQPALVVAGCDPALALLAGPLSALTPPRRLVWWPCNSATALDLAASGLVHAAGVHLPEGGPGIAAVAGPRLAATGAEVIGFGAWAEGLALRPGLRLGHGGPAGLLAGLAERGLRIVNREDGSEARQLLDDALAAAGVAPDAVAGYGSEVRAHLLVASAVAAGLGAAGVTMEPAARAHGLDFVALAAETFQLVVPRTTLHTAETQALLQILSAAALRLELGRLPGYDPTTCGEAVATI